MTDQRTAYADAAVRAWHKSMDEEIIATLLGKPSPMLLREEAFKKKQANCTHTYKLVRHGDGWDASHYTRECTECGVTTGWNHKVVPDPGWET